MYRIVLLILLISTTLFAQNTKTPQSKSQFLDEDGIPILTKNLPNWETAQINSTYIVNSDDLKKALGEKEVLKFIDFAGATEAVTANYDQGKLLLVEFNSPQVSIETDNQVKQFLAEKPPTPPIFYRRIGNFNAFVFDAKDETSANLLLEQISYGKKVQWLGKDPYLYEKASRFFAKSTSEVLMSIVYMILGGLAIALSLGFFFGYFVFAKRRKRQSVTNVFTDAGGMTRLNLDDLSSPNPNRLLGE